MNAPIQTTNKGAGDKANYSVFIKTLKSISYPERVFWLAILLSLIGGLL